MSSVTQNLATTLRLFESMPGLAFISGRIDSDKEIIELATAGDRSAHVLCDLCQAANATLEPPFLLRDPDFNAELDRCFTRTANVAGDKMLAFGNLQALGIHFVWKLHEARALSGNSANKLLQEWNSTRGPG